MRSNPTASAGAAASVISVARAATAAFMVVLPMWGTAISTPLTIAGEAANINADQGACASGGLQPHT